MQRTEAWFQGEKIYQMQRTKAWFQGEQIYHMQRIKTNLSSIEDRGMVLGGSCVI